MDSYYRHNMLSWLFVPDEDPQTRSARLITPDTCNFDTWSKNGMCSFTFSGFSDLFGVDLRLNAYVKKCSSHEYPEIYVECAGTDCSLLSQPKFCNGNQDCTSYATCTSLEQMIQSLYNRITDPNIPRDFFSLFVVDRFTTSCRNNLNNFVDDVKSFLGIWSKALPLANVCSFDLDHLISVARQWAQTQISQDGMFYRLINLRRWNV